MKIHLFGVIGVVVAALSVMAPVAKADSTISGTTTISGTFDYTGALALQQFNTSLGTLNSVTITISAVSLTDSISITNTSPTTYSAGHITNDVQILIGTSETVSGSTVIVQTPFDSAVDALNPGGAGNYWVDAYSPTFNVAGLASGSTSSFTNQLGREVTATSADVTSGALFTDLQGTGTTNLNISTLSEVNSSITGGATFSAAEIVTGTVQAIVTYDYTPVTDIPEPGTFAMALCGFGILFFVKKKKILGNQGA